jgi:hypothetical protein
MDFIQEGDVIVIQRQSYMKTHKLATKKPSLVQLGKLKAEPVHNSETWDRRYDLNFLRFLPIFSEKNWRFSQKPIL